MNYTQAKKRVLKTLAPEIGEDFYTLPVWHLNYRVSGYEPNGIIVFDIYEHGQLIGKQRRFALQDVWRKLLDGSMKRELR